MTITIPVWVFHALGLYLFVGAVIWVVLSRLWRIDAALGCLTLWPLVLCVWASEFLKDYGWFLHLRGARDTGNVVDPWSRRTVRGRWSFLVGTYATTAGWGSRWIRLGPVVVGRRRSVWALTEVPPVEDRTGPGPDQAWEWPGNTEQWQAHR